MPDTVPAQTPAETALSLEEFGTKRALVLDFVRRHLVAGVDYDRLPGSSKPALLKPGAEKLCDLLHLSPVAEIMDRIEDWDREPPLFAFTLRVRLIYRPSGQVVSEGIGSANSREGRYRWRWVRERDLPPGTDPSRLVSRQTRGERLYRIENDDVASLHNTLLKMAEKRALIDAITHATSASDLFADEDEAEAEVGTTSPARATRGAAPLDPREFVRHRRAFLDEARRVGLNETAALLVAREAVGRPIDSRYTIEEWQTATEALRSLAGAFEGESWTEEEIVAAIQAWKDGQGDA